MNSRFQTFFLILIFLLTFSDPLEGFAIPQEAGREGETLSMHHSHDETAPTQSSTDHPIDLPKTVGNWTLQDATQAINAKTIFEYMDGAGELYVGYRFNRIDVYEYQSEKLDNILVELYWMESSDDAFGLLSTDWGGDPVSLSGVEPASSLQPVPSHRALYGAGLLRLWADRCYARVMSYNETPQSKEAVLEIGRAIVRNQKNPDPPAFLQLFPSEMDSGWKIRSSGVCYFRSHLVLNSIYYLSSQNILNFDRTCEALIGAYENDSKPDDKKIRVLAIQYADEERKKKALERFHEAYLPEFEKNSEGNPSESQYSTFQIEDGWTGYAESGKTVILVFEAPDWQTLETILSHLSTQLKSWEKSHVH